MSSQEAKIYQFPPADSSAKPQAKEAKIYNFKSTESSAQLKGVKEKTIFKPISYLHSRVVAIRARGVWRASFFKPKEIFKEPKRIDIPPVPIIPTLLFSEEQQREKKRKHNVAA